METLFNKNEKRTDQQTNHYPLVLKLSNIRVNPHPRLANCRDRLNFRGNPCSPTNVSLLRLEPNRLFQLRNLPRSDRSEHQKRVLNLLILIKSSNFRRSDSTGINQSLLRITFISFLFRSLL